jgi:hypothetical protein
MTMLDNVRRRSRLYWFALLYAQGMSYVRAYREAGALVSVCAGGV